MDEAGPALATLGGSQEAVVMSRAGSGYLGSQPLRLSLCLSHSGKDAAGPLVSH